MRSIFRRRNPDVQRLFQEFYRRFAVDALLSHSLLKKTLKARLEYNEVCKTLRETGQRVLLFRVAEQGVVDSADRGNPGHPYSCNYFGPPRSTGGRIRRHHVEAHFDPESRL